MESNRQLPTSYIYVETKRRLFEDKTSLNDCMLTIFDYDKIFQWMDGWVGGRMDWWMNGWMDGWMDGWRWMEGPMKDEWMDERWMDKNGMDKLKANIN